MFSSHSSPIAIDFGSSSIKLLQIGPGEKPSLLAAVGLRVPDECRKVPEERMEFLEKQVPRMLRKSSFKGRRAVCSIPASETLIQHMQITAVEGVDRDETVKMQLADQRKMAPNNTVVRTYFVTEVTRDGETLAEMICFAINRDVVMRYVSLLEKARLEVVGVHSEIIGMVRAFDYLQSPTSQASVTTLYVDIGWGATKVAIAHDSQLVFARAMQIGGRNIDERIAQRLGCDAATARAQRISEQVLTGNKPSSRKGGAVSVAEPQGPDSDIVEVGNSIAEELSMCLRYHQSLFRDRRMDRIVFLGGEARNIALCQQIAKQLQLAAQLGDPLTRLECKRSLRTPGLTLGQPQPGWAVVCGLCSAPTDL